MRHHLCRTLLLAMTIIPFSMPAHAGLFDDLTKDLGFAAPQASGLDDSSIVKGLKEALSTGTTRAVKSVAQPDGYFSNAKIKILMPEKVRSATELLSEFGFQSQVDDFILSMNRAAEKAAPKAVECFVAALKEMSFDDARKILQGDTSAATEYFKQKTGDKIHAAFKPVVSSSMRDVGVVRSYTQMTDKLDAIPFGRASLGSWDLDNYVTTKAVDGLFVMLGEEEKKIRTDPAARGTELLKKVFGN